MSLARVAKRILASSVAITGLAFAQGADAPGGKDHTTVARYQGSRLVAWRDVSFAEVRPLSFIKDSAAANLKVDRDLALSGSVAERYYVGPRGRTALEVQLNYEEALKRAGARLVYGCDRSARGACMTQGGPATKLLLNDTVPRAQQIQGKYRAYQAFAPSSDNLRLAFFEWTRAGATTYFLVYSVDSPTDSPEFGGSAATFVQIVEPKPVELGKVTLYDAAQIAATLESEGRLALYAIEFDTGKAELLPRSRPQLEQMAQALNQRPDLKVFIVGHTDNTGSLAANVTLSQQRADAVVAALVRDHRIHAARLAPKGVASYAPVASNADEAGRARNRRVEMVVQ